MKFRDFQTEINRVADRSDERWIYRGHASESWRLESSYSRFLHAINNTASGYDVMPFQRMLDRFTILGSEILGDDLTRLSLFERMALAQHHGVPTPLLDWSYSPYVALYFAVMDASLATLPEVQISIHALEITHAVEAVKGDIRHDALTNEEFLLFINTDRFFSRRLSRQLGCFTYQNFLGDLTGWSAAKQDAGFKVNVYKYQIDGLRKDLVRDLRLMGLTGGRLFDDLDFVARDVVQEEVIR
jgi:hypothetical protein